MLSVWWLLLIVPLSAAAGYFTLAIIVAGVLADLRDSVAIKLKEIKDEQGATKGQDQPR